MVESLHRSKGGKACKRTEPSERESLALAAGRRVNVLCRLPAVQCRGAMCASRECARAVYPGRPTASERRCNQLKPCETVATNCNVLQPTGVSVTESNGK